MGITSPPGVVDKIVEVRAVGRAYALEGLVAYAGDPTALPNWEKEWFCEPVIPPLMPEKE